MVKQVRASEPDTLVFIVHAVPSAPMQRIFYEVYRDRAAFEAHKRQPYVTAFEADRRPYVLATNVIELGLQQAKVSPLPSVSDLLSDTGFDLLSDTGFGQPGYGPRSAGGPAAGGAGARRPPARWRCASRRRAVGGITGGWTAGGGPASGPGRGGRDGRGRPGPAPRPERGPAAPARERGGRDGSGGPAGAAGSRRP